MLTRCFMGGRVRMYAKIAFRSSSVSLRNSNQSMARVRGRTPATLPVDVLAALGVQPIAVHAATKGPGGVDYIVECADEATVTAARPDMGPLKNVDGGVILTAAASTRGWDFVSRYFVPAFGIDEDPVTGSAHCALAPYWAARLGRPSLTPFRGT